VDHGQKERGQQQTVRNMLMFIMYDIIVEAGGFVQRKNRKKWIAVRGRLESDGGGTSAKRP
jgi:hypothetical protein